MKSRLHGRVLLILVGTVVATGVARAADAPSGDLVARVERVTAGGRELEVTDREGARIRVVRPARPPQASITVRDGDLVNDSALHEGDTVLIVGARHGDWVEARRIELLSEARVGGATAAERVLRLTGFAGGVSCAP